MMNMGDYVLIAGSEQLESGFSDDETEEWGDEEDVLYHCHDGEGGGFNNIDEDLCSLASLVQAGTWQLFHPPVCPPPAAETQWLFHPPACAPPAEEKQQLVHPLVCMPHSQADTEEGLPQGYNASSIDQDPDTVERQHNWQNPNGLNPKKKRRLSSPTVIWDAEVLPSAGNGRRHYSHLIAMAIQDKGVLPVNSIYDWVLENYPYYKTADELKWKAAIRHALTTNPDFVKAERAQRGWLWDFRPVDTSAIPDIKLLQQHGQGYTATPASLKHRTEIHVSGPPPPNAMSTPQNKPPPQPQHIPVSPLLASLCKHLVFGDEDAIPLPLPTEEGAGVRVEYLEHEAPSTEGHWGERWEQQDPSMPGFIPKHFPILYRSAATNCDQDPH